MLIIPCYHENDSTSLLLNTVITVSCVKLKTNQYNLQFNCLRTPSACTANNLALINDMDSGISNSKKVEK